MKQMATLPAKASPLFYRSRSPSHRHSRRLKTNQPARLWQPPDPQPADNTAPVAGRTLPQPMALSDDEIHSLEQLVQRTEDTTVAVMAFSEQPDSHPDTTPAPQPSDTTAASTPADATTTASRATPSSAPAAFEPSVATAVSNDADSGTPAASSADLEALHPTKPQAAPQPHTLAAAEPTEELQQSAAVTQGHVGVGTVVASPDSLRALVTRTRPEATPEPAPEPAENASASGPAGTAQATAPERVREPATRAEATAKGLQSAAAALERAEAAAPVKSLLTRTLGPTTPAPPQPAAAGPSTSPTEQPRTPANPEPATTASWPAPATPVAKPQPPAPPGPSPAARVLAQNIGCRGERRGAVPAAVE